MIQQQSIVFFDGVCNLCNGFVQFVLKHEAEPHLKFCSLQSDYAVNFFKEKHFVSIGIDSVIVFENNQFYIESEAAFKIINKLKWPYKALYFLRFTPKFINNSIYKFIAKHRYRVFGKSNVCWVMNNQLNDRFL